MKVLRSLTNKLARKPKLATREEAAVFTQREKAKRSAQSEKSLEKDEKRHAHNRKEQRHDYTTIAELSIPDLGLSLDGIISEASEGGFTFRPATDYLLDRTGENVQIIVDSIRRNGVIRSTRANGYGVQLYEPFKPSELKFFANKSVDLTREKAAS